MEKLTHLYTITCSLTHLTQIFVIWDSENESEFYNLFHMLPEDRSGGRVNASVFSYSAVFILFLKIRVGVLLFCLPFISKWNYLPFIFWMLPTILTSCQETCSLSSTHSVLLHFLASEVGVKKVFPPIVLAPISSLLSGSDCTKKMIFLAFESLPALYLELQKQELCYYTWNELHLQCHQCKLREILNCPHTLSPSETCLAFHKV